VIALAIIGPLVLAFALVYFMDREGRAKARAWDRKEMAWSSERKELLDRIMFLADRPWREPPRVEDEPEDTREELDVLQQPIPLDEMFDFSPAGRV
jgi:hypothetical protein